MIIKSLKTGEPRKSEHEKPSRYGGRLAQPQGRLEWKTTTESALALGVVVTFISTVMSSVIQEL